MYALVSARHRHDGLGCSAVLLGREVPTYRTYVFTSDYLELVLLLAHSTPGKMSRVLLVVYTFQVVLPPTGHSCSGHPSSIHTAECRSTSLLLSLDDARNCRTTFQDMRRTTGRMMGPLKHQ